MFIKMKINKYLSKKDQFNNFDLLLKDYIDGNLKRRLIKDTGIRKFNIIINNLNLDNRKIIVKSKIKGRFKEVIINEVDIACGDSNTTNFTHYKIDNIEIVYSIMARHFLDK